MALAVLADRAEEAVRLAPLVARPVERQRARRLALRVEPPQVPQVAHLAARRAEPLARAAPPEVHRVAARHRPPQ